jgi:hypothetical protein
MCPCNTYFISSTLVILVTFNLEKLFVSKRLVKSVVLVDARKQVQCKSITEHNYEV